MSILELFRQIAPILHQMCCTVVNNFFSSLYSWLPAIALLMPPPSNIFFGFFPGEIFLRKPSLDGERAAPPENNNRYDPTAVYN
jgi:hypothetical protein